MIYLLLAVLSSALVSIVMRLSTDRVSGKMGMLAMNYVTCLIVAGAYTGFGSLFPAAEGMGRTLGLGVLNGALYLGAFMLLQWNVEKNGVVLASVFMKLGLLVPMVLSIFLFGEIPAPLQIAGFVIAVAAIVLMNMSGGEARRTAGFGLGLILLLLVGGSADAMSKVFEQFGAAELSSQFLFYTFAVALLLCLCLMACRKERLGKMEALYGVLVGIPNYFSARFLLLSLGSVPAVIAYPTFSVATIFVVALVGVRLFRERLALRQRIAIGVIVLALVLLNVQG